VPVYLDRRADNLAGEVFVVESHLVSPPAFLPSSAGPCGPIFSAERQGCSMNIVERYRDQIRGVIACFDRIVIQGILPYLCYADGMTSWLRRLQGLSAGQVSRILKRLRVHGLIKRVGRTYKYYLTSLGRRVILTGLKLRELVVIPELAMVSC